MAYYQIFDPDDGSTNFIQINEDQERLLLWLYKQGRNIIITKQDFPEVIKI